MTGKNSVLRPKTQKFAKNILKKAKTAKIPGCATYYPKLGSKYVVNNIQHGN
jgi:hypothetical protein